MGNLDIPPTKGFAILTTYICYYSIRRPRTFRHKFDALFKAKSNYEKLERKHLSLTASLSTVMFISKKDKNNISLQGSQKTQRQIKHWTILQTLYHRRVVLTGKLPRL